MRFFLILLQINIINSQININETVYKIKYIINNYKTRNSRCVDGKSFVKSTLSFLHRTEAYGDFFKSVNVSQCVNDSFTSPSYIEEHIKDGLLVRHDVPETHWQEYKTAYNKQYDSDHHEMAALEKWRRNLRRVATHNQQYLAGKQSYSLHLNHFGDFGATDYLKNLLKLRDTVPLFDPAHDHHRKDYRKHAHKHTPNQVDWRAKGFKPRLEQQWHCGACYAFTVAHALQAQLYKRHGDWKELSTQQIVDCSYPDGNDGCEGGSLRAAMRYISRAGLIAEKSYPYKGKRGHCHYNSLLVRAKPRRWAFLPAGDEHAMELALATIGPLAVGVNAAPFTFQLYRSGIYDDLFCTHWQLNHAMLLVGYTKEYWILLNWWGKQWGGTGLHENPTRF